MTSGDMNFRVCMDESDMPAMFGIECKNGQKITHLSTDYAEVERLVRACNQCELSMTHFWEVVEDFRRA